MPVNPERLGITIHIATPEISRPVQARHTHLRS